MLFDLDSCIAFITNNASKKISDCFNERLIKHGLTRVQWIALYFLEKYGNMSQKDLAKKMDIKGSSTARLVDRMERDGYVKRVPDKNDRRAVTLMITDSGKEMLQKLTPVGEQLSQEISKDLSAEEIAVFKKVIQKMIENVEP